MKIFNDYEIDENGNVYSYKSNKYLTPHLDRYGYLYVTIKSKHYKVHRLVAEAFLDNPSNKPCVDHIDRNGLNNQKSNLRLTDTHLNKRNQNTCSRNRFNFNGIGYEPKRGTHSARIRASWCEDEYDPVKKRYKTRNKSFSLSEYGFNEALRLAVLTRIQKMRKFDYIIDERSETIERKCLEENPNMEEILGISFKDFE